MDWIWMWFYGVLLLGFVLGGVVGVVGYVRIGYRMLVFLVVFSGVSGMSYVIYKYW